MKAESWFQLRVRGVTGKPGLRTGLCCFGSRRRPGNISVGRFRSQLPRYLSRTGVLLQQVGLHILHPAHVVNEDLEHRVVVRFWKVFLELAL